MDKALHPKDNVDSLYGLKKEGEEDLPALRIALTYRHNDSKTILKSKEED